MLRLIGWSLVIIGSLIWFKWKKVGTPIFVLGLIMAWADLAGVAQPK